MLNKLHGTPKSNFSTIKIPSVPPYGTYDWNLNYNGT